MNIVQRPLKPSHYYREECIKKNIVLHHTVSSTGDSALRWWAHTPERVGTAFVIDKDGTVLQAFEPRYWAHHLGLRSPLNKRLNQQSIGIEIVNEGLLWQHPTDGTMRWMHPDGPVYKGEVIEEPWRGHRFWAAYTPEQEIAVRELITLLRGTFTEIPDTYAPPLSFLNPKFAATFGIYYHHNVRADKTDLSPAYRYDTLTKTNLPA